MKKDTASLGKVIDIDEARIRDHLGELKFARDRKCWRRWLFESRKRFGLCVLNYVAKSATAMIRAATASAVSPG